jgi:hypothetical protein
LFLASKMDNRTHANIMTRYASCWMLTRYLPVLWVKELNPMWRRVYVEIPGGPRKSKSLGSKDLE